jgi:hypothetical protein
MSIIPGLIFSSSSLGATLLSDIDNLGLTIPDNVYQRWSVGSTVTHTTNNTQVVFEFTLPSSITEDCAVFMDIYRLSICTAGTSAGLVAAQRGCGMMNRNGSTWTSPASWTGGPLNTYATTSGVLSLTSTFSRSGDTLQYKLIGIASQTIASKVFCNVMVVKTP